MKHECCRCGNEMTKDGPGWYCPHCGYTEC